MDLKDRSKSLDEWSGIQAWMQAALMKRPINQQGIPRDARMEDFILRSKRMTCEDRLAVYMNAYSARLIECLRDVFARTYQALGEEVFDAFAANYIHRYPSMSYTLDRLGDRFVNFLTETWRDQRDAENGTSMDSLRFVIDLAKLDFLEALVFDGPGSEAGRNRADDLEALKKHQILFGSDFPDLPIAICPSVRLETFDFPVHLLEGPFESPPHARQSWVALHRVQYTVRITELNHEAYEFLSSLNRFRRFTKALDHCATSASLSPDMISAWFQQWTHCGILLTLPKS